MRKKPARRILSLLSTALAASVCGTAFACSPVPPLEMRTVFSIDGLYSYRLYDPNSYAFRAVVLEVVEKPRYLGKDGKPTRASRVRVIESMTPQAKPGDELEISGYVLGGGSACEGSYSVDYVLPKGKEISYEGSSLAVRFSASGGRAE